MYTRVVEINCKPGRSKELTDTIHEKVVSVLKKQRGFVDETILVSDTDPNRVLGLSYWNSKEEAERYHQEQYPKVREMLQPLLEGEPVIQTFDVHTSTPHRIAAGKAA
jgi:quinol monooxygenase YgiN